MNLDYNSIPGTSHPSQVCLRVKSLSRVLLFYRDIIGWSIIDKTEKKAFMSASGHGEAQLVLVQSEDAHDKPEQAVGLYHTAFRFPSRRDLADAIKRVAIKKYPFEGASDHLFSEALYLSDPEGNGVEIYADRPQDQWPRRDGKVQLIHSKTLNIENLLTEATPGIPSAIAPVGADIGHIHLHVKNIDEAKLFFNKFLGMEIMYAIQGACFLSAGGYHHHIAANVWSGSVPVPENAYGLMSYRIKVPDQTYLDMLKRYANEQGYISGMAHSDDGVEVFRLKDPNGHWMELTT
jgi:catechol 2,3-dioxygenase